MASEKVAIRPSDGSIGAVKITVLGCRCRCGHEWISQEKDRPRVCPKCKSANWDKPKKWNAKTNSHFRRCSR